MIWTLDTIVNSENIREICQHCKVNKVTRPRGLCNKCYYDKCTREQYPLHRNNEWRSIKLEEVRQKEVQTDEEYNQLLQRYYVPTSHKPGTVGKLNVLIMRGNMGVPLFHPLDAKINLTG